MCPKLPDETEVNVKGESPGPVVEKMFTAGLDLVQHSAVELRGARAKAPLGRRHADGFCRRKPGDVFERYGESCDLQAYRHANAGDDDFRPMVSSRRRQNSEAHPHRWHGP